MVANQIREIDQLLLELYQCRGQLQRIPEYVSQIDVTISELRAAQAKLAWNLSEGNHETPQSGSATLANNPSTVENTAQSTKHVQANRRTAVERNRDDAELISATLFRTEILGIMERFVTKLNHAKTRQKRRRETAEDIRLFNMVHNKSTYMGVRLDSLRKVVERETRKHLSMMREEVVIAVKNLAYKMLLNKMKEWGRSRELTAGKRPPDTLPV